MAMTPEHERLLQTQQRSINWTRWGPYVSERAWGTVREDYSPYGTAWDYLPHDVARSKAYRWGEDGLAGICDPPPYIFFSLAPLEGRDPLLKKSPFGLSGSEGKPRETSKKNTLLFSKHPHHHPL